MIDVVIVSHAKSDFLKTLTQQAIDTAIGNEHRERVNVIVVESNKDVTYSNAKVIYPEQDFNYNRFLNLGASEGDGEYICFSNNDLIFHGHWASKLIDSMVNYDVEAASPYCPHTQREFGKNPNSGVFRGMEVRRFFAGWCFVLTRNLWTRIGQLDERYKFWFSDNIVAEYQLKKHHASHIMVSSAIVEHLQGGSKTLGLETPQRHTELTMDQARKWNRDFNQNRFGVGK